MVCDGRGWCKWNSGTNVCRSTPDKTDSTNLSLEEPKPSEAPPLRGLTALGLWALWACGVSMNSVGARLQFASPDTENSGLAECGRHRVSRGSFFGRSYGSEAKLQVFTDNFAVSACFVWDFLASCSRDRGSESYWMARSSAPSSAPSSPLASPLRGDGPAGVPVPTVWLNRSLCLLSQFAFHGA